MTGNIEQLALVQGQVIKLRRLAAGTSQPANPGLTSGLPRVEEGPSDLS
jgi:hypothetical protein